MNSAHERGHGPDMTLIGIDGHLRTRQAPDVEVAPPAPLQQPAAAATEHRAVLQAAAAAIPGAAAADVDTIATFLEGLDDSFFGDDL